MFTKEFKFIISVCWVINDDVKNFVLNFGEFVAGNKATGS